MSEPVSCPILQIGETNVNCSNCPLAKKDSNECVWRIIKKAYQKGRGEKFAGEQLDSNQPNFTSRIHIITFAPAFEPTPAIKVYTIPFLQSIIVQAKCSCGYQFLENDLRMYLHDGGIYVDGCKGKQWVFAHCRYCGYDMSIWKILRQIGRDI